MIRLLLVGEGGGNPLLASELPVHVPTAIDSDPGPMIGSSKLPI